MKYTITCPRNGCGFLGAMEHQATAQVLADTHNTRRGHHQAHVVPTKATGTDPVEHQATRERNGGGH